MNNYCRILIVDDEIIMRQGMKHIINWEKEGFQIVGEASNGREALDLIEQLQPHIVLSDIVMPVLDGMELSKIMQSKYPEIQTIILSGYDKFEYVKTALLNGAADYILKSPLDPDDLLRVLKRTAEKIPGLVLQGDQELDYEQLLEKYLLGFEDKLDTVLFSRYFVHSRYRLFGIDLKAAYGRNQNDIGTLKAEIWDRLNGSESMLFLQAQISKKMLFYVVNYRVSKAAQVLKELAEIAERIRLYQEHILFVASGEFSDMEEIRKRYQNELLPWAENGFYFQGIPFVMAEKLEEPAGSLQKLDFQELSQLQQKGEYREALGLISTYIHQAVAARVDVYKLKNMTKNLLYNFILCIDHDQIDMGDLRQQYFRALDEAEYAEQFCQVLDDTLEDLRQIIKSEGTGNDQLLAEIRKYMEQHYREAIDLKSVAAQFNFHYSYLSTYFTSRGGENFTDFLNKIRIDHACDLLCTTVTPISAVSQEVGYSDHSYFCRVFKKQTGYTPSGYRRHYGR